MKVERYGELDGLRGVAALAILFFHSREFWIDPPFSAFRFGYVFVDLFFVLSGIVLSHTYEQRIDSGRIGFHEFLKARVARMGPLHWFVLFFMVIANSVIFRFGIGHQSMISWDSSWYGLAMSALFLQGSGLFPIGTWNAVAWSISAEMVFNILWFYLVAKRHATTPVLFCLIFVCTLLLFNGYGMQHDRQIGAGVEMIYGFLSGGVLRCVIGFSTGILICRHILNGQRKININPVVANILTVAVLLFLALSIKNWGKPRWLGIDYLTVLFTLPSLVCLTLSNGSILGAVMRSKPFVWIGDRSYSIYLVHLPMFMCVSFFLEKTGFSDRHMKLGTVYTLSVLVVSALTYRFIEQPARIAIRNMGKRIKAIPTFQE